MYGYICCFSNCVMKIFAYAGAQIVHIAHFIFCKTFMELKTKLFRVSIKLKNVTFTATVLEESLS